MLCDRCKKNEATIHVKKVINGKIESLDLCQECARQDEEKGALGAFGFNLAEVLFNIDQLGKLQKAFEKEPQDNDPAADAEKTVVCSACGWDMASLRKNNGKLGCPECYQVFSEVLENLYKRVQRGNLHIGKRPAGGSPDASAAALRIEIAHCKRELAALVGNEEYEKAAVCRDHIALLQSQLDKIESTTGGAE